MREWLESVWYGRGRGGWLLIPLGWLFGALVWLRRALYLAGLLPRARLARPLIVVGNLSVGGTGKTPLVVALAGTLKERGLKVGVVSRGYGGTERGPRRLTADSDPAEVGDEPYLIARRTGVAVAIGADRAGAAALLVPEVDIVIADDGLQHYRLRRDLEIAVIDAGRGFGNGRLLPAGPLREPRARLKSVGIVVGHGPVVWPGSLTMRLEATALVRIGDGRREAVDEWRGRRVHAVAGIGNPERFFATLLGLGVELIVHPLPDHARLTAADVTFEDGLPVVMTEKDAVKCESFAASQHWYLEVAACFSAEDATRLLEAVQGCLPAGSGGGR